MFDGLSAVIAGIYDDAVSVGEALLARNFCRCEHKLAEEGLIFSFGVGDRTDVPARDDEDVGGRFWVDVREGVERIILVDRCGGDLAFGDLAENAV